MEYLEPEGSQLRHARTWIGHMAALKVLGSGRAVIVTIRTRYLAA